MSWMIRLASPEEYLGTLGAPPETIDWIMSQPDPQFYINEYRKNPGINVTTLHPPQKQQFEPTRWERDQAQWYREGDPRHKWTLVQLRKMRTTSAPIRVVQGHDDYDYGQPTPEIQQQMREIDDWYQMTNEDENVPNIDIASYSWEQAVAASDEWHAVAAGEGAGKIYSPVNPELVMFRPPEWNGWSIQKVVSRNDLAVEGNLMNQCVGRYCLQVDQGLAEIYSLRDPKNVPHVTIEIDPKYNEIVQIMGNSDTEPDDKYKIYIKQWFDELQKERPGLKLGTEDAFNFDDLRYVNNNDIDEEINRIVYRGNEYGLKVPLDELDVQNAYDAVIHSLTGGGYRSPDTQNVIYIGPVIANIAWDADKYRANEFGVIRNLEVNPKYRDFNPEQRLNMLEEESSRLGVGWLWDKIEKNHEKFYKNFDFYESYLKQEDYETEEELENAQQEEQSEAENTARSESLPYALDDAIATVLIQLAKEDPFLPAHFKQLEQTPAPTPVSANSSWIKKIAQADLSWILSGPGEDSRVGPESGDPVSDGISIYSDPNGSYRYVYYENGQALAGIQVVSDGKISSVANVYTHPLHQRRGLATALFRRVESDFPNLQHSTHQTDKGGSWINSLSPESPKAMPLPFVPPKYETQRGIKNIDTNMGQDTSDQLQEKYPDLEYGGAGAYGVVFQPRPGEMIKVTRDWSEANTASAVFKTPTDWVVPILSEPKMIQEEPPLWTIHMKKLDPLDLEFERLVTNLAVKHEDGRFPNTEEIVLMLKMEGIELDRYDEAFEIYAEMQHILDKNQSSFWLTDIHGGNVGWDSDGHLKVFDFGSGDHS